jgi:hypothetical protein
MRYRSMETILSRLFVSTSIVLFLGACSTLKIHSQNKTVLESALKSIEAGTKADLARADIALKGLLANTGNVQSDYQVQRFFAQYMLARLNMDASHSGAFLTEPKRRTAGTLGKGKRVQPSKVAHLVATVYNSAYGADMYESAAGKPVKIGGEALLPESLAAMGVERAGSHLQLCLLTTYSQLQLQTLANQILDGALGITTPQSLEEVIAEGEASASMKPWIFRAMFFRLQKENARTAFGFGARMLEAADDLGLESNNIHAESVRKWLQNNEFGFICPSCEEPTEVQVDSRRCRGCRETEWRDFFYVDEKPIKKDSRS